MTKHVYQKETTQLMQDLNTTTAGLTQAEAQQRLQEMGLNQLAEAKKKSALFLFLETFKDAMVIVLLIVAIVQMIMGAHVEALVIFAVLLLNSLVSVIQAKKAEGSLDALKKLAAPDASVLRSGQEQSIPAKEIVTGDIVILEAGDYVPADGRLLEASTLKVDEGMLTGESTPAEKEITTLSKEAPIGDRINMVFSGTIVTYGRGKFLVTATGNTTEIGQVADLLESTTEQKTPLQRGLDLFSKKLSFAILILSLVILGVQLLRIFLDGSVDVTQDILNAFMFAVAVAVAAIPEALQSIVTIVLSLGTKKMAKHHAIIRKLPAVETLGSTSIICTDKTGTLTQNKMTVVDHYLANGQSGEFSTDPKKWQTDEQRLIEISVLANDATISKDGTKLGDPTEIALIDFSENKNQSYQKLRKQYPREDELPFDSDRKLMSTLHTIDQQKIMVTKGGPDIVFERSTKVLRNGQIVEFTAELKNQFQKQNEVFAERALRVLAFAYKEVATDSLTLAEEEDLVLVGLLAMIDPPRAEVFQAVADANSAGIQTVMITGDHKTTAVAIAKEIGIFQPGDQALTGVELDQLSEVELAEKLAKITVYARVSPENKIRIVRAWQEKGKISAMTGDGVNDAPALKQADIGIAMGTGTDVAKDAAAMVLTDDNFASIIKAVEVGRNVFDNIKKAVAYLFAGNLGAIIAIVFALAIGWSNPFTALQLLFINLVNDSLPAIALGMEKAEPTIMKRQPRDPNSGIFTGKTLISVTYRGILIALAVITAQWLGNQQSPELGVAMAFTTLILSRTLQTFAARSNTQTSLQVGLFSNKMVLLAILVCGGLFSLTLLPGLREVFAIPSTFALKEIGLALSLATSAVLLMEITKLILVKIQEPKSEIQLTRN
ncbi:cation-translocating P-type ATPase [Enterococcus dongliensis]|uniref:P-type Ca(2+) transporter n=1 Tax=Enterococcus dongliensis TaxID=2559925 RepID=A0AAP5KN55_9ENTE|nr:cation-translocating P-type ATPase [Enterococcus dongliensis]MDT2595435.1 cation-translocating P-type ATPase [Enterococcus dongliensis]MDT2603351.1 cation-translocating P-type ATPase [Enterococcus dongliensis]MDT2633712.1 cation-translocating P-type ATPase [Enterococcus dongliensis]MDT2635914.1 cation-translocating P-type ATPase [Enterococcus dongliensis]MDT2641672.1 cation-translocating P-type ATPase [Enterococcus dongliensis]